MAVFVVEFSYGLTAPFMWLSVGKHERNRKKSDDEPKRNGERFEGKPECNNERQRPSLARISVVLARRTYCHVPPLSWQGADLPRNSPLR